MVNPRYCKATWVNIAYIIFHELTGINVIMLYSNQLFKQMASSGDALLTPRQGTYLVGIVNALASLLSTQIVKCFGRRTLVIWGHLGMAGTHAAVGYFASQSMNTGVIVGVLVFLMVYQNSSGPVAWLYATETSIDAAFGVCLFTLWGTVFVLSLVCPALMDEDSLGPTNVFYIFAGLSFIGSIFCGTILVETQGLTDKQKKLIFTPKRFLIEEQEQEDLKSPIKNEIK